VEFRVVLGDGNWNGVSPQVSKGVGWVELSVEDRVRRIFTWKVTKKEFEGNPGKPLDETEGVNGGSVSMEVKLDGSMCMTAKLGFSDERKTPCIHT
jgi:hypothetical protein